MHNSNMPYRLFNRCVMDTTDMDIIFDENGYCNHCSNAIAANLKDGQSINLLDKIIRNIKKQGKNRKYDCIVGISGGVDSSYSPIFYGCPLLPYPHLYNSTW